MFLNIKVIGQSPDDLKIDFQVKLEPLQGPLWAGGLLLLSEGDKICKVGDEACSMRGTNMELRYDLSDK